MHRIIPMDQDPVDQDLPVRAVPSPLSALLVDPALFTAPYDAALSRGLMSCGVKARWATRALRAGEDADISAEDRLPIFYPLTDGPRRRGSGRWQRALKGVEHALGLGALVRRARQEPCDVVHFQWSVVPFMDLRAIARLRVAAPVILTVHDLVPFNGKQVSRFQRDGFETVVRGVDHVIVHTPEARSALVSGGVNPLRVSVVPHGMLPLGAAGARDEKRGARWRIVLFGKIQSYKGVDVLVEAAGLLPKDVRKRIEIVVAGEPMIPMDDVIARASALGLDTVVRFETRRFSDGEMAALLTSADCFIFPYRAIEASGVLHLVAGLGKWIIASRLGVFRDMIGGDGQFGALTEPGSSAAIAAAMTDSIGRAPAGPIGANVPGWDEIGGMTREIYEMAIARHAATRQAA